MGRNLVSIIARWAADGSVTVGVYVGAGVALVLLPVSHGSRQGSHRLGGALGLLILAGVFVGALVYESHLLTSDLPRLMRGARPW